MLNNKSLFISLILVLSVIVVVPSVSFADWSENLIINGFGHQSFIKTDTNSFVVSNSNNGSFNDYVFGITFTAAVNDDISIKSQVLNSKSGFKLDWGFADYKINENYGARFGKIKLPFGLYGETQDVKALQPFSYLPETYSNGVNSFNGVGVYSNYELDNDWAFGFEFSGGTSIIENGPGTDDDITLNDLIVVSANISTPIPGTNIKYAYAQTHVEPMPGLKSFLKVRNYSGSYSGDNLFINAEYQNIDFGNDFIPTDRTWFIESGYMVYPNVQSVFRYAQAKSTDIPGFALATMAADGITEEQNDIGFGVNYFLSSTIVIKGEHHIIDGNNRIDLTSAANAAPSDKWNLTAFSVAFTF